MRARWLLAALLLTISTPVVAHADGLETDDPITRAGQAFAVAWVVGGAEGLRSVAQLYNPPGSARVAYVDSVTVTHSAGPSGVDIRIHTGGVFGDLLIAGQNKDAGGPCAQTQLRAANLPGDAIPGIIIHESGGVAGFDDRTIRFVPAIRLPPGTALLIATGADHVWLPVSIQFREY